MVDKDMKEITNTNVDTETEEEVSVREILNSDMTPTQALNFLVSGVQIALEGDFYELEDKLILEKALGVMFEKHQMGENFEIIVK